MVNLLIQSYSGNNLNNQDWYGRHFSSTDKACLISVSHQKFSFSYYDSDKLLTSF